MPAFALNGGEVRVENGRIFPGQVADLEASNVDADGRGVMCVVVFSNKRD